MIKYSKKLFLFLILFFYIYILLGNYAIFAYSKSSIEDLSIEELMNVSISSNIVRADKILPASVTLLTGEQLIMSGARTLNEALSLLVPGYCMIEDQDDVISGFRGLAPDNNAKVMLLINGQNMNTEFFWGPPDCILNSIDFDWIENIEIIRGPGSVTLGQGALLGAINIITKKNNDNESSGSASLRAGSNNYYGINLEYTGSKYYVYIAKTKFSGFKMENSGWGSRNFEGAAQGLLYNAGHKVKRSDNHTIFSRIASKNFSIDIIDIEQTRDLYNFYRDRDIFDERLQSITANFKTEFSSKLKLTTTASFTRDDFFLNSVNGIKTGGTREERFGIKSLLNANEIPSGNDLAIGVEARLYSMGKNNSEEANYIINRIDTETLSELQTANNTRTFACKDSIRVFSFFAENFY
nr:TonB-dependent receptor plug domain-containing protein [Candidatus Dependentiae bacterium]